MKDAECAENNEKFPIFIFRVMGKNASKIGIILREKMTRTRKEKRTKTWLRSTMTQVSRYVHAEKWITIFCHFQWLDYNCIWKFSFVYEPTKTIFSIHSREYISLPYAVLCSNLENSSSCLIGQCRRLVQILIQCFNQIFIEFIYNFIL